MYFEEYPHALTLERTTTEIDKTTYPPKEVKTTVTDEFDGFMDTPTTSEQLNFHNLNITLDRNLFVPYDMSLQKSDVIFFKSVKYKIVGDAENQGGQDEVLMFRLTRV